MNAEANVVLEERRCYVFTNLDLGEGQNGSVEREAHRTGGQNCHCGLHNTQCSSIWVHEREGPDCSANYG